MERFDKYWIGILIGLLLPALFCYLYLQQMNLLTAIHTLGLWRGPIATKLMIIGVFPDAALLFLFYELDTWRLAKGILIGSFPYILLGIALSI